MLALTLASVAVAQGYPSKPIRFVVPYAPGGNTDILSRLIGQKLNETWGQQVIIDNRPGGLESLRQSFPGLRVEIIAQAKEFLLAYPARQSQKLSAVSQPLPQDAFAFAVIIASTEVFLKVLLSVYEAVFRFRRQHA